MRADISLVIIVTILFLPPSCIESGGVLGSGFHPKDSIIVNIWRILDREAHK